MSLNHSYVSFLTDEQIYECIGEVFKGYENKDITFKSFNKNRLDPFQMIFSSKMEGLTEEEWVEQEVKRQLDKSLSNLIGSFQEEIIGKAAGFKRYKVGDPEAHSMDIISDDKTIIADMKNKYNTVKGSSHHDLFSKLEEALTYFPDATAYYVKIIDKKSYDNVWEFTASGEKFRNNKIHEISGDKFYALVFGVEDAFSQFVRVLPKAIEDFIEINKKHTKEYDNLQVIKELNQISKNNNLDSLYGTIANETFDSYDGFKLK